MMSRRLTEGRSVSAADRGLGPGSERSASTHSVEQMVAVPRRWDLIGRASRRLLKRSPSRAAGRPVVHECVEGGARQWEGAKVCPSDVLPCQQMKGRMEICVTHKGRSVFSCVR